MGIVFDPGTGQPMPSKSQVGYLDPEIAGEGQRVDGSAEIILSDGERVSWTPPPAQPVIPDLSQVKSLRKYFGKHGFVAFPAWIYHPTDQPVIVKNQEEANKYGLRHRQATPEELVRYGRQFVWDWNEDTEWRPVPYGKAKFDPKNAGQGKNVVISAPDPIERQNDLVRVLLPQVAEVIARELKDSKSSGVNDSDWKEFLEFMAWKESMKAAASAVADAEYVEDTTAEQMEWDALEKTAVENNIKIDRRWSLGRLKREVETALEGREGSVA